MRVLGPLVLCAAMALAAPAAFAGDPPTPDGSQAPASGGTLAPPPPTTARIVSAGGPVELRARAGTMLRRVTRFRGSVAPAQAGRTVAVERFDALTGTWLPIATATVDADGRYLARWRTDRPGGHRVRAVLQRPPAAAAAFASGEVAITVHRRARATWYGPGLYGNRTACGQRMTRTLLGVAHKRLPCGTQVALLYRGRTITVPVVDRGPFRRKVRWDLTAATAQALGFEHTDRVGAVRVQAPPAAQSSR